MKKIGFLEASATRTPMARTLAAAALVACALQPATAGWVESYDKKSNKKFYYDEETRKTQWEKPDGETETHGVGRHCRRRAPPRPHPTFGRLPSGTHHSHIWGSLGGERIL